MADESVSATTTIAAPAHVIFGVLADQIFRESLLPLTGRRSRTPSASTSTSPRCVLTISATRWPT
jgi:hypothetical protein